MAQSYDIRPFESGDEQAILETFNLVFGEDNPDFTARAMADWEWTYTRNPGGIRVWVAMQDGLCAAHYASQPHRTWIEGEERIFGQIIDSMVHPDHRRGLKRPGLFVETAQRMLAATCGPTKDLVTYGWPVPEAWRMGKTFLRYEMVRMETILSRDLGPGPTDIPAGVERIERFDPSARALYERCARGWRAGILRDERFLNWRFVENPRHTYHRFGAFQGGELQGYCVFRVADWPVPQAGLLLDWLVPPEREDLGEALREAALAQARVEGARALLHLSQEWNPWHARFQDWGWIVHPSNLLMSGRNNMPRHDMAWLRDHWWYQFSELDLV